jgi:hypothetical protein
MSALHAASPSIMRVEIHACFVLRCSGMQGAVMLVANRETRREYAAKIIDTRKCVPCMLATDSLGAGLAAVPF